MQLVFTAHHMQNKKNTIWLNYYSNWEINLRRKSLLVSVDRPLSPLIWYAVGCRVKVASASSKDKQWGENIKYSAKIIEFIRFDTTMNIFVDHQENRNISATLLLVYLNPACKLEFVHCGTVERKPESFIYPGLIGAPDKVWVFSI